MKVGCQYASQVQLLRQTIPVAITAIVSTIDGFQGREGDVAIISTVFCNAGGNISFVEVEFRLNVSWTLDPAEAGLIIVGDKRALQANSTLCQRAEVVLARQGAA
ncbi:uncharacterized protein TRAVEDRAFT_131916 [Trametes versicolor FP-101664 SS1]|uniref:uncharacterized protein n=1 Tax=Trametes versicolor (strain FP-101664) TaxID=717944 RepID=UPI000462267E|nr:uncharacterized protein TRAVEDRAFT_131916 [Trametes versicolor FP-101664 SS1]EIW53893.1 hypothetical protein TRAVEDRAFT_131916 [Trametes versicolor FP-101664 SS1]